MNVGNSGIIIFVTIFILGIAPLTSFAFAQETQVPGDLPINVKLSDLIIIVIGMLGGLTTAGLGIAKNRNKIEENKKLIEVANEQSASAVLKTSLEANLETKLKFDPSKFGRTLVVAIVTAMLLAVASATVFTELNLITMVMIYAASMGMSSVSKPGKK